MVADAYVLAGCLPGRRSCLPAVAIANDLGLFAEEFDTVAARPAIFRRHRRTSR
jgi:hypothetical protein